MEDASSTDVITIRGFGTRSPFFLTSLSSNPSPNYAIRRAGRPYYPKISFVRKFSKMFVDYFRMYSRIPDIIYP